MEEINLSPTGNNLYIYTRVSTDLQVEKGGSLDEQKNRGIEFAKKNNYAKCIIYEERGKSASGDELGNRPILSNLLNEIDKKNVKHLFVFDTTRLSRNDITNALLTSKFKKYGVRLFTNAGEFDFRNDNSVIMHTLLNAVNLFDANNRKRRFQMGNVAANKRGKFTNPFTPYGWQKYSGDEPALKGLLEINAEEAKVIRNIIDMYLEKGMGTTQIARILNSNNTPTRMFSKGFWLKQGVSNRKEARYKVHNKWNPGTINSLLQNTCLYGQRKFKIGTNEDGEAEYDYVQCPAIIDKQTFDALQQKRKRNHQNLKKTPKYFKLLSGLCVCSCGCSIELRIKPSQKEYTYVCSSKRDDATSCKSRGINMFVLNNLVWKSITNIHYFEDGFMNLCNLMLDDEQSLRTRGKVLCDDLIKTEKELTEIDSEINALVYMFTAKKISEARFDFINTDYNSKRRNIEQRILELQREKADIENLMHNEELLTSIGSKFSSNFGLNSQYLNQIQDEINNYNCKKPTDKQIEATSVIKKMIDKIAITFHKGIGDKKSFHEIKIVFNIGKENKREFIENIENPREEIKTIKKRSFLTQIPFFSPQFITEPSRLQYGEENEMAFAPPERYS